MINNLFFTKYKQNLLAFIILFAVFFSVAQSSYAAGIYSQGPRSIGRSPVTTDPVDDNFDPRNSYNNMCLTESLKFSPLAANDDIEWELDNAICITYVATVGVMVKGAALATGSLCGNALESAMISAEAIAGIPISPSTLIALAAGGRQCVILSTTGLSSAACCASTGSLAVAVGLAVAELAIIWEIAKDAHKYAKICGNDWLIWGEKDIIPKDKGCNVIPNDTDTLCTRGDHEGSYKGFLQNKTRNGTIKKCDRSPDGGNPMACKHYREYLYGGIEYRDQGKGTNCQNPDGWEIDYDDTKSGFNKDYNNQRYYMRGSGLTPHFACHRFNYYGDDEDKAKSWKESFECCNNKSRNTLCIENKIDSSIGKANDYKLSNSSIDNNYKHGFCAEGQRCNIGGIWFDVFKSRKQFNYLCAKTYSLCPYNHLLGGGTEYEDLDDDGNVKNYCQFMKHCVRIPGEPYIYTSSLSGAYFDASCRDIKGDSQNSYSYDSQLVSFKHFSAPITQCFKETLENIFLNKAGSTKCNDLYEIPNKDGECKSGYKYKKGDKVEDQSFFSNMQDYVRIGVKVTLTLAIMIIGITILLGGKMIDRRDIMLFVVKLGLVSYFVLGLAWQNTFFDGVFGISADIADIVMNINENEEELGAKLDGCQFPKLDYTLINDENTNRYNGQDAIYLEENRSYPPGLEYLRIWDTLDCKIALALGFGPEATIPNLFLMILGALFSGFLGIIFMVASLIFAFYLIALTIRAVHIFLISSTAIILMIYVSPIIIPLTLFKRTERIFKQWALNLLGFILQPVILFAYLGIMVTIFDAILIGDATFDTSPGSGLVAPKLIDCSNAEDSSIYCIFRFAELETYHGLEAIGIGIPILFDMNYAKISTIAKGALLMFFFAKFLDAISSFASQLVGGQMLSSASKGTMRMAGAVFGALRAIEKRGTRAFRKQITTRALSSEFQSKVRSKIGATANVVAASAELGVKSVKSVRKNIKNRILSGGNKTSENKTSENENDPPKSTPQPKSKE